MIEKLKEKLNNALLEKLEEEFNIEFDIKLVPKDSTLANSKRSIRNSENQTSLPDEKASASKKSRGRPSHKELVEEYLNATNEDAYLLPDLSEKLGIHTSKLRDILPMFGYFYNEETKLWERGRKWMK